MIDVILTKLSSIHDNLRTDEVEGVTDKIPEVGQEFHLVGEALIERKGYARLIVTTKVKEVRLHPDDGSLEFWTENSHYGLQVLDMDTQGGVS